MIMNVGELKKELENHADTDPVMLYLMEDAGMLKDVRPEPDPKRKGSLLYCKGDHPFEYNKNLANAVCLIGF
jgi:hypothetical protein